jgi:hypothetical protein
VIRSLFIWAWTGLQKGGSRMMPLFKGFWNVWSEKSQRSINTRRNVQWQRIIEKLRLIEQPWQWQWQWKRKRTLPSTEKMVTIDRKSPVWELNYS